jgi:hypothetical protein
VLDQPRFGGGPNTAQLESGQSPFFKKVPCEAFVLADEIADGSRAA